MSCIKGLTTVGVFNIGVLMTSVEDLTCTRAGGGKGATFSEGNLIVVLSRLGKRGATIRSRPNSLNRPQDCRMDNSKVLNRLALLPGLLALHVDSV